MEITSFDKMAIALFIIIIVDLFIRNDLLEKAGILMVGAWIIYRKVLRGDIGG